jgi:hypothetical protein
VQPTLEGENWRLLSTVPIVRPIPAPSTFLKVLQSWGNTWLWDHMSVSGGTTWLDKSILEGTLVAVTDGSYIRELFPNLCSAAFVLKCSKGCGRVVWLFSEALIVANAYWGELLGLMAIHLILLSINKIHPMLAGSVEIVSDGLGALKRVTHLPPYQIPSQCQYSDILKTILVNCRDLIFTTYYSHIKLHQDDQTSFSNLSRKAQLNCICDHSAKHQIATDGIKKTMPGKMFPLEPVGLFVRGEKMMSETGSHIHYWAHHHLARNYYRDRKVLTSKQFDNIDWKSIQQALHDLPQPFQLWEAKHVLGIVGTMKFLSHQDGRSPLCPSCSECKETCKHIRRCQELGCAVAFAQLTHGVEAWLDAHSTHPNLKLLLLWYLQGRGTVTCIECSDDLNLPQIVREYAISQDVIGWDNFAMGMISSKLLPIQSAYNHSNGASSHAARWISGLITQLLQVTHTQWIYRCVLVHHRSTAP